MSFTTRRALWRGLRRVVAPLAAFLLLATQLVLPSPAEAATITFRSAATAVSAGEGALEIETPAGVEPGDLLIAQIVATDPGTTITPPTGWNLIRIDRDPAGGVLQAAYHRAATADEAAAPADRLRGAKRVKRGRVPLPAHCSIHPRRRSSSECRRNPLDPGDHRQW